METINFLGIDFLLGLLRVLVAVILIVAVLRLFDKLTGTNFKESFRKVREDAKAFAHYRGCLAIAAAILIGSIL